MQLVMGSCPHPYCNNEPVVVKNGDKGSVARCPKGLDKGETWPGHQYTVIPKGTPFAILNDKRIEGIG